MFLKLNKLTLLSCLLATTTLCADQPNAKAEITITNLCGSTSRCDVASFIPDSIKVATVKLMGGNNAVEINTSVTNSNPAENRWQIDPNIENSCSVLLPDDSCNIGVRFIGFKRPSDILTVSSTSEASETLTINYRTDKPKTITVNLFMKNIQWDYKNDSNGLPSNRINALAYSESSGKIFFATSKGLGITSDNQTFTTKLADEYLLDVAVIDTIVLAGSGQGKGVYYSADNGDTFAAPLVTGLPRNVAVNKVALHADKLYAGTTSGLYMTNWTNPETFTIVNSMNQSINDIIVFNHNEQTIILLATQNGLYRKIADQDFVRIPLSVNDVDNPAINALDIITANDNYSIFVATDKGFAASQDSGTTFTTVEMIGDKAINSVFVETTDSDNFDENIIYVAAQDSKLYGSLDNGVNFIEVMGFTNQKLTAVAIAGNTIAVTTTQHGVGFPHISTDGLNWSGEKSTW